jgi:hypothetical protein
VQFFSENQGSRSIAAAAFSLLWFLSQERGEREREGGGGRRRESEVTEKREEEEYEKNPSPSLPQISSIFYFRL